MAVSDDDVMAYVDGELDEAARSRITLAALADPDLAERIAAQRRLRDALNAHFAPVMEEPVPAEWTAMIRAAEPAPVIDLAAARAARDQVRSGGWSRGWMGGAIAASLVLGLVIGGQLRSRGPIEARGGALIASGDLGHALDTQLASAQAGQPIRMLATFAQNDGSVCRAFAGPAASGIACHAGDGWHLQHVLPGSAPATGAYQQAGSHDADLMAMAQAMATGDAFDASQERAAMIAGWHAPKP
jgi:anti-sigma factor RsiW